MIKKNLIGIGIVFIFFVGFYAAYTLGKNSSAQSGRQQGAFQPENQTLRENAQPSQTQEKRPISQETVPVAANIKPASAIQPALVAELAPASQQNPVNVQTFYGTVNPVAEANVQSEQGGKILTLKGKEGEYVKKGAVIVCFDDSDAQLELQQAISSKNSALQKVQEAESNFNTVQTNAQRYQKLFDDGFISKQQLDEIANQLESARSTLNSAKESVTQAETQIDLIKNSLKDFQIHAPISGYIDVRNYNVQEIYKASDVIYHLVNIDQVYIEIDVPETYIARIREKMEVSVMFDALDGRLFPATIETILPSGAADNRTFTVKALSQNSDHAIKPGMFARVNVTFEHSEPEFAVSTGTVAYKQP